MIIIFRTDKAEVIQGYRESQDTNGTPYHQYFTDPAHHAKPKNVIIKEAPEPNEIIWEHIDEPDDVRRLLIFKGYALTFGFLAIITVVFYFILLAKTRLFISAIEMEHHATDLSKAKHFKIFATIMVYVAIFGVVLFNKFVMGRVLHSFVHGEKHAFTDKGSHSFAIKYAVGMFFTTALMTLAVEAVTFRNFYSHEYGVIEEETIMFFVTAFLIPLIWFIHPYNLMRKLSYRRNKDKLVSQ